MSPTDKFFDETTDQSEAKSAIVSKYFSAWAKVIVPSAKQHTGSLAYIDLFAGPGRYQDGTRSTPLLILEKAIEDNDLREMLVTIFNDKDTDNSKSLMKAIKELPGLGKLKHAPQVKNQEIGSDSDIVRMFGQMHLVPTLIFVDPWGYKGLSLQLVNSVLKDWGCDCIFFFNYNRINMGLSNPSVQEHMNALFGEARAAKLRATLEPLSPQARELTIVEELSQALRKIGGKYVLPFCFKNNLGKRTSHHLIFVSKAFRGYAVMKDIMAKESSSSIEGVPSFVYSPATPEQPLMFEFLRPLTELGDMLLSEFAGQQLTMKSIYENHSVGKPYIAKNYKDVLRKLEASNKITAVPPAGERLIRNQQVTFADHVVVTFPKRRPTGGH